MVQAQTMHPQLREHVRLLGGILGDTIREHLGADLFGKIESIRAAAKQGRADDTQEASASLLSLLETLSDDELVPVTRSFNQFLNLANIAEQYHGVRRRDEDEMVDGQESLEAFMTRIRSQNVSVNDVIALLPELCVEFVLTAHPTEVTRRTLIKKYEAISGQLARLDHTDLTELERKSIERELRILVAEAWHTDELRSTKPTAVDEAKWGFSVIENSLWDALPRFLREVEEALDTDVISLQRSSTKVSPIRFASWMGGDRDGNPNVTAKVTQEVLLLSRWMATDLYLGDIRQLRDQLSMWQANDTIRAQAPDTMEPYREVLGRLRDRLQNTQAWIESVLPEVTNGPVNLPLDDTRLIFRNDELLQTLEDCYQSLLECGMQTIANGLLRDTLYRARCFGLELSRLDVRQESTRHAMVLQELTEYLGLGDYAGWSEERKVEFLLSELQSRRPLIPQDWPVSDESREVLDTCAILARHPAEAFGSYVISMASTASDVLAVILLLKESGVRFSVPVVPLFETLDDLTNAPAVMKQLFVSPWYGQYINGRQQVMIGYSDSAKDAGQMAAAWAQYQAQENLVALAKDHGVRLTLFHGRGGTVGRGGGPANRAILSQPPGSVGGSFRITEQGEMIRFKFGQPEVAVQNLRIYLTSVIEATLLPPEAPKPEWREMMNWLTTRSLASYRDVVRGEPDFVPYFRLATPEQELGKLALGSRPAKRKADGGIESLRAIPWIFAWTQNRMMLPAWLGGDEALAQAVADNKQALLETMLDGWPFFKTHIDMLEMVLAKGDVRIADYYDQSLVPETLRHLGQALRVRMVRAIALVNQLKGQTDILRDNPVFKHSMVVRAPYTDPLHYLQAELLRRNRVDTLVANDSVEKALKITMAGIAAGMRNTG